MEYRDLTARQRQKCVEHVERCINTFRTDAVEDVIGFAIDAYLEHVGDDMVMEAVDIAVTDALSDSDRCEACAKAAAS